MVYRIEERAFSHIERIEDQVILEFDVILPQITGEHLTKEMLEIQAFYDALFEDETTRVLEQAIDVAKENHALSLENDFDFMFHAYELSFTIESMKNETISILMDGYFYQGGAHPGTFHISQTFSTLTGKRLTLGDVMGLEDNDALEMVFDQVSMAIENNEDMIYYEEALQTLREYFNPNDFYLKDETLMVYFGTYAIAPYAAGIQYFEILY